MEQKPRPSTQSIQTSGELAAMGAAIRAILRKQFGDDRETLREMRDAAKAVLQEAAAPLKDDPDAKIFVDAANETLDDLFGV
jgi:hypothetical protein